MARGRKRKVATATNGDVVQKTVKKANQLKPAVKVEEGEKLTDSDDEDVPLKPPKNLCGMYQRKKNSQVRECTVKIKKMSSPEIKEKSSTTNDSSKSTRKVREKNSSSNDSKSSFVNKTVRKRQNKTLPSAKHSEEEEAKPLKKQKTVSTAQSQKCSKRSPKTALNSTKNGINNHEKEAETRCVKEIEKSVTDSKKTYLSDHGESLEQGVSTQMECAIKQESQDDDTSSSESEWEEVKDENENLDLDDYNPEIPKEGVEITLEGPKIIHRKKKKTFDMMEYIRLQINRDRKELQLTKHKVHLLCLVAHGMYLNNILNMDDVKGVALSMLPAEMLGGFGKKTAKIDIDAINKLVSWFCDYFTPEAKYTFCNISVKKICKSLEQRKASNVQEYNMLLVAIARALGLSVRLCHSLFPISFKTKDLLKKPKSCGETSSNCVTLGLAEVKCKETAEERCSTSCKSSSAAISEKHNSSKEIKSLASVKAEEKSTEKVGSAVISDKHTGSKENKGISSVKRKSAGDSGSPLPEKKGPLGPGKKPNVSSEERAHKGKRGPRTDSEKKQDMKRTQKTEKTSKASGKHIPDEPIMSTGRPKRCVGKKDYKVSESGSDDSDDDFVAPRKKMDVSSSRNSVSGSDLKKSHPNDSTSGKKTKKKNRKMVSSDSEDSSTDDKSSSTRGVEYWLEIYAKASKKWISIECFNKIVDRPYSIEKVATQPISYVIALDNLSYVKDVTKRYCSQFLTETRKLRPDPEWWDEALEPFLPPNTKEDRDEESQLEAKLLTQPLPKTIGEYKNHPLYVLKRHLLKFQALYPADVQPVGFIRGEPVYSRDAVHTLHSRETWVKEARMVRVGEEPYKIVKARPKWDRMSGTMKTDLPCELFGHWQTEEYMPPIAHNGKVPRNEYGNVELFKPCMLPIGTVHLQLPGMNRICKKLGIDCAPAVVGFDGHKGSIHPVYDGFIVCEEFEDAVVDAWNEEQDNILKREEEKREKRIYGNWKKLIKGLLIRERIKAKYLVD